VIDEQFRLEIQDWIAKDPDPKTATLLRNWLEDENEIELRKSFNGFLEFGTAGLRGPVRPGPSGMNRAVVGRTAAGIASYLTSRGLSKVVIGRDARYGSAEFMEESAEIFAGAGLNVHLLPRELPTPILAYAVNELNFDCGVMVTASHNPAIDNGYKVYLGKKVDHIEYRGSQIISPADVQISAEIAKVQLPSPRSNSRSIVSEELIESYLSSTAKGVSEKMAQKIIYTAMHGVGTETLLSLFAKANFSEPILVSQQARPDPDFPTVAFPNPEEAGAMDLAIALAAKEDADLIIANDPDADRCAVAAKDKDGHWRTLRGDELGTLLGHYISKSEDVSGKVFATTIVSSSALSKIAAKSGVGYKETLTGFKWISKVPNLAFGYEEAIGYCVDPKNVNDKDGLSAALKIAEINSELKAKGSDIFAYLDEIWIEIGYHRTQQLSIRVNDLGTINRILSDLSSIPPKTISGLSVTKFEDLSKSELPTEGFRFYCEGNVRVIIRPSGTEPKLKTYIEVVGEKDFAEAKVAEIVAEFTNLFAGYS
jgi:phosphomannomutase